MKSLEETLDDSNTSFDEDEEQTNMSLIVIVHTYSNNESLDEDEIDVFSDLTCDELISTLNEFLSKIR